MAVRIILFVLLTLGALYSAFFAWFASGVRAFEQTVRWYESYLWAIFAFALFLPGLWALVRPSRLAIMVAIVALLPPLIMMIKTVSFKPALAALVILAAWHLWAAVTLLTLKESPAGAANPPTAARLS